MYTTFRSSQWMDLYALSHVTVCTLAVLPKLRATPSQLGGVRGEALAHLNLFLTIFHFVFCVLSPLSDCWYPASLFAVSHTHFAATLLAAVPWSRSPRRCLCLRLSIRLHRFWRPWASMLMFPPNFLNFWKVLMYTVLVTNTRHLTYFGLCRNTIGTSEYNSIHFGQYLK